VPVTDAGDLQRLMTGELIGRTIRVGIVRGELTLDLPVVPVELALEV
jgi:hypothetical protein